MTPVISFSDLLPRFKAEVQGIAQKRLETGPRTGFRIYCHELSEVNRTIVSEVAKSYITGYPSRDFTGTFTVVGGSAGRDECIFPSDFDFVALPTGKDSVSTAQTLQAGMNLIFEGSPNLPFWFNKREDFSRFHGFCIEPEKYPDKLLVDGHPFERGGTFIPELIDPCRAHSAIRDFTFTYGNENGFRELTETCAPRLYPFSADGDIEGGKPLITQMIEDSNKLITKWGSNKSLNEGIKDTGLRLLQLFKWIISAKENIRESSNFYNIIDKSTLIESQDKETLKSTYENLLMVREARILANQQYNQNPTLEQMIQEIKVAELEARIASDFDNCVEIIKDKLPQIL